VDLQKNAVCPIYVQNSYLLLVAASSSVLRTEALGVCWELW